LIRPHTSTGKGGGERRGKATKGGKGRRMRAALPQWRTWGLGARCRPTRWSRRRSPKIRAPSSGLAPDLHAGSAQRTLRHELGRWGAATAETPPAPTAHRAPAAALRPDVAPCPHAARRAPPRRRLQQCVGEMGNELKWSTERGQGSTSDLK